MIKKIFLDMDGVLSDFISGVCGYFDVPFDGVREQFKEQQTADCVRVAGDLCGHTVSDFWNGIDEDFWTNLNKLEGADLIVDAACNRVGVQNVGILTSPGITRRACHIAGKLAWVEKHYPQLAERVIPTRAKYMCASSYSALVDDWEKMVDSFRAHDGSAILVPRFWNCEHHLADQTASIVKQRIGHL